MKLKKISAAVLAALCAIPAASASADALKGANTIDNVYKTGAVVTSYLYETDDGFMIVQSAAADGKLLVRYYDKAYKLRSEKLVELELPIFGAFSTDGDNYYVLTGRDNHSESDFMEVFMVTKYDKDWNKVDSAALYGAKTIIPFDEGSARMIHCGNYLIVRTCRTMYKTDAGLNPQSNLTFMVDTRSMGVSDEFTGVQNEYVGYVGESYNQFLLVDEDDHLVTVDEGAGDPRAVTLIKYGKNVSQGGFSASYDNPCSTVHMLPISGDKGDSRTGVTVGGFEESDSHYIVAGATIDQTNFKSSKTRNIFVSTVGKDIQKVSDTKPEISYITSIPEGSKTVSSPVLVTIDGGRFLLMWEEYDISDASANTAASPIADKTLCYTILDSSGHVSESTKTFKGTLSDCKPILSGYYVEWYARVGDEFKLYRLDTRNFECSSAALSNDAVPAGDVNGDGRVNAADAVIVLKHSAGVNVSIDLAAADANSDGKINVIDAVTILKRVAGVG